MVAWSHGSTIATMFTFQLDGHVWITFKAGMIFFTDFSPKFTQPKIGVRENRGSKGGLCDVNHITQWLLIYLKIWGQHHILKILLSYTQNTLTFIRAISKAMANYYKSLCPYFYQNHLERNAKWPFKLMQKIVLYHQPTLTIK